MYTKIKTYIKIVIICGFFYFTNSLKCYICNPSDCTDCTNINFRTSLEDCDERNETPYEPKDTTTTYIPTTEEFSSSERHSFSTQVIPTETTEVDETTDLPETTEGIVSTIRTTFAEDQFFKRKSFIKYTPNFDLDPVYECYKVITKDNLVSRGCRRVINANLRDNCLSLQAKDLKSCEFCSTNQCNSGDIVLSNDLVLWVFVVFKIFIFC